MTELDDRLRVTLAEQADELPASPRARAELERRLAVRAAARGRRPALAASAAAVVLLVGVAVPVLLSRGDDAVNQRTADQRTTDQRATDQAPTPGTPVAAPVDLIDEAVSIGQFADLGRTWDVFVYATRNAQGNQFCLNAVPEGEPHDSGTRHPNSTGCEPMGPASWPMGPANQLVASRQPMSTGAQDSGPLSNLLVFATTPQVASLEVRAAYDEPVEVVELGTTDSFRVYLATFDGSTDGFGYTAKDASGAVLEEAIT